MTNGENLADASRGGRRARGAGRSARGLASSTLYALTLASRPDVLVVNLHFHTSKDAAFFADYIKPEVRAMAVDRTLVRAAVAPSSRNYSDQRGAVKWLHESCSALNLKVHKITSARQVTDELPQLFDQYSREDNRWALVPAGGHALPEPWIAVDDRLRQRAMLPLSMILLGLAFSMALSTGSLSTQPGVLTPVTLSLRGFAAVALSAMAIAAIRPEALHLRSWGGVMSLLVLVITDAAVFLAGTLMEPTVSFGTGTLILGLALASFAVVHLLAGIILRWIRSSFLRGLTGAGLVVFPVVMMTRALTRGIASGLGLGGAELTLRGDQVLANYAATLALMGLVPIVYAYVMAKVSRWLGESFSLLVVLLVLAVVAISSWTSLERQSTATGERIRHGNLANTHGLAHVVCLTDKSRNRTPFVLVGGGAVGSAYFRHEKLQPHEKPHYATFYASEPVAWRAVDEWKNGQPACKASG